MLMNKSKVFKAMLIVLAVAGPAIPLSGCAYRSETPTPQYQAATVERGNITVDVSATGNLSYALAEDLAFEIGGYVEEVTVEEGDEVSEGQVLASLDTTDLETAVTDAEKAVENAKVAALQAQASNISAEASWKQADYNRRELQDLADSRQRQIAELQVEAAELSLEASELKLEMANSDLVSAEDDLTKAQEELDKATIVAPFDGFVTRVDVGGGDEVFKGTVALQVVDPTRFKAEIMVGEKDIFNVKAGQEAQVQVDALTRLNLPAKVTYISPIATIQSGVVTYEVDVELESLETIREEMMKAAQQTQEGQEPTPTLPEDFQLKEGLNVTVSIIVDKASDVLVVPNQAITYRGGRHM